jgi:hypothetical protein
MLGSSVALMFLQSVVGVKHGELGHGAVAGDLGDDGGGGDGGAAGVAVDDGELLAGEAGAHVAVDEAEVGLELEALDGAAHGEEAGAKNIVEIDFLERGNADGPVDLGVRAEEVVEVLTVFAQEELGVVEVAMLEAVGEDGGGGEDGAGPAAAADFINAGDDGNAFGAELAFEFPAKRVAPLADHRRWRDLNKCGGKSPENFEEGGGKTQEEFWVGCYWTVRSKEVPGRV